MLRFARQQLPNTFSHHCAPEAETAEMLRHAAAAVRCAQRDDAPGLLLGMIMKQRTDQDATQTVSHEMHGIDVERFQELRQLGGIGMEIGAHGSIGKRMNNKSLTA